MAKSLKPLEAEEPPELTPTAEPVVAAPAVIQPVASGDPQAPGSSATVTIPSPNQDKPIVQLLDPAVMARAEWENHHASVPVPEAVPDFTPGNYQVTLLCPTPLAAHQLTVEASTPDEAKEKFFAHNGICATEYPINIQRLAS